MAYIAKSKYYHNVTDYGDFNMNIKHLIYDDDMSLVHVSIYCSHPGMALKNDLGIDVASSIQI